LFGQLVSLYITAAVLVHAAFAASLTRGDIESGGLGMLPPTSLSPKQIMTGYVAAVFYRLRVFLIFAIGLLPVVFAHSIMPRLLFGDRVLLWSAGGTPGAVLETLLVFYLSAFLWSIRALARLLLGTTLGIGLAARLNDPRAAARTAFLIMLLPAVCSTILGYWPTFLAYMPSFGLGSVASRPLHLAIFVADALIRGVGPVVLALVLWRLAERWVARRMV
jgi:hypothetical protein